METEDGQHIQVIAAVPKVGMFSIFDASKYLVFERSSSSGAAADTVAATVVDKKRLDRSMEAFRQKAEESLDASASMRRP
jgi:hypothetical protein